MQVRSIDHGSAEYRAACELRHRFLREPLGLRLTDDDVAGEETQHHFGLFVTEGGAERLVGGVIGAPDPVDPPTVRIRQMVVHEADRGRGLGRVLLAGAEAALAERGFSRFVLYARPEATGFYERCGYSATGETAELIGLEHLRMAKGATAGLGDAP